MSEGPCARFWSRNWSFEHKEPSNHSLSKVLWLEYTNQEKKQSNYCFGLYLISCRAFLSITCISIFFFRNSSDHPLLDTRVWLMDFSVLFCMVGTLTLYVIYKVNPPSLCRQLSLSVIKNYAVRSRFLEWLDWIQCHDAALMFIQISHEVQR